MEKTFYTKEKIDFYLDKLAKKYKSLKGEPFKIVIVGGSAVTLNYDFRNDTQDVDAYYETNPVFAKAIAAVGEEHGLSEIWLNKHFADFLSYPDEVFNHSYLYASLYGVLDVYTMKAEYLIASKIFIERIRYKDKLDIIGILLEERFRNNPITYDMIADARRVLVHGEEEIPVKTDAFLKGIYESPYYDMLAEKQKEKAESLKIRYMNQDILTKIASAVTADDAMKLAYDYDIWGIVREHGDDELSDEELENVSGGGCPTRAPEPVWQRCPNCGQILDENYYGKLYVACCNPNCFLYGAHYLDEWQYILDNFERLKRERTGH